MIYYIAYYCILLRCDILQTMLQILNGRILNNSIDKRINCGNSSGKILMLQILSDACLHMLWEVGKTPVREGAVSIMHRCWISALMPIYPTYRILTIVYRCLPDYPIICTHTANDHPTRPYPTLPIHFFLVLEPMWLLERNYHIYRFHS